MNINPAVVIAGIYLSAKLISFIAGELTENELKKQAEIDEQIELIKKQYQSAEPTDTPRLRGLGVSKKVKALREVLTDGAATRINEYEELLEEIKASKKKVVSALNSKDKINTPLRITSLELLLRQLSEAQSKCISYKHYLEIYREKVSTYLKADIPCFSMQLPQSFPYSGKVYWVGGAELQNRYLELAISDLIRIKIIVSDKDLYELDDNNRVPIMITNRGKYDYYASLEKGAFKEFELANTHLGFEATVKELQRNHIILTYQNSLELYLSKDNLIRPNRFPPVHSSLTVYPIKWEFDLSEHKYSNGSKIFPVKVSERKEDAGSSLSFSHFPICFTEEELKLFKDVYENKNLTDYDGEFLIGPIDADNCKLKKGSLLKLQFGDIPLFFIEIDEHKGRTDILRYYFRFHSMCNPDEKTFSADDVFLPLDVSFAPYFAGTSDEMIKQYMGIDDLDDVAALIWDLFEEFRVQEQIRKNRDGIGYFYKWESITTQLISVLEQGDSIVLSVNWTIVNRNCVLADVDDPKRLERFIDNFAKKTDSSFNREWKPHFFVKDDYDNRYITDVIDSGRRLRIVGKNVSELFVNTSDSVELFASNQPYSEYQQKIALRQFRTGQVVNPFIQAACLNSTTIENNFDNSVEMMPFHNAALANNPSQRESVQLAYKARDVFLIQGPPGTGKTTVIRELVEQVLETSKDSRVLIVSQANVAVDNALAGLIDKHRNETVRCGNANKISEDFQGVRLQKRCQDYLDELESRQAEYENDFFNEWHSLIQKNGSYDYSPVLCELIIRNHRLIGATCVGLAKRNIGLERTEFDLVIIDEAGKALPAEMLIPLVRAKKAIIIGDQRQLPPVINPILYDEEKIDLEERAISENDLFCHSFFERMYENAPYYSKRMLDTQYRMPAVIGTAISELFYNGTLKNGSGTESKRPILFESNLSFINFDDEVNYRETRDVNNQITNPVEAKVAVSLVRTIRQKNKECKIAVITPYKGQKRLICNSLVKAGIRYQMNNIYVDTIDSFQGSEADVVLFCTTRAVRPTLFFKDMRRINVALSRARNELILLGKMSYFYKFCKSESCLPRLAQYIKTYGIIVKPEDLSLASDPLENTCRNEMLLSIDVISLPSSFFMEDWNQDLVQSKIDEYYKNGDFIEPLHIVKTSNGYLLCSGFEQYRAAMELGVNECLCKLESI